MLAKLFQILSFSELCKIAKEKFLSFPSISEGVKHVTKLFTILTANKRDDLIHEIIEPDWTATDEFLKTSADKKASEKVRFTGERLISLGQKMVANADRFDEIK